jgi:hypothetical protein
MLMAGEILDSPLSHSFADVPPHCVAPVVTAPPSGMICLFLFSFLLFLYWAVLVIGVMHLSQSITCSLEHFTLFPS